ncbi:MAG TPA: type II toxin-antitoxin system VapC family toxin [Thiotrichales bacterium]|nr:type II toxin-antitoxin system VapC family toxin [Thiotrichales bacterium]
MIAFDTNLLVRLAVNDNIEQATIAEVLLNEHEVFVSRTVLLETEWVLRSVYKQLRGNIAAFFEQALNTTNLYIEDAAQVKLALEWYQLGADFADAIHLCICQQYEFHTFDEAFCKRADQLGITPKIKRL